MHQARWLLFVSCALLFSATRSSAQSSGAARGPAAVGDHVLQDPELPAPTGHDRTAASGGGEVIQDPELAGSITPDKAAAAGGDSVISDPELSGASHSQPSAEASMSSSQPDAGDVRLVLHTRGWYDVRQDDPREEIWDSMTVAAMEATIRRSESLRFSIGIIASYHWASLAADVSDANAQRYALDAMPTTGYVDATVAAGLHVRLGYQPVHLGRFDAFSATNVLSSFDVRQGPATLAEVPEVGQLAALVDLDVSRWLSLRAIYIPFFTPNIVSLLEGPYALIHLRQPQIDATVSGLGMLFDPEQLRALLGSNLSRGDREAIASTALSTFAPPANLMYPQGALRATAHGPIGELAATFATALEHTPAFRLSDAAMKSLTMNPPELPSDPNPISVEYNRYALVSVDGAIDAGPFSIGFELAYQWHRTLYAVGIASLDPITSQYAIAQPDFTDVAQAGLRIEYVQGAHWLFALESFGLYAISAPSDPHRGWMFLQRGAYAYGAGGLFGYSADFGLQLELGASFFMGPSFILSPRIAYTIVDGLDAEIGGLFIMGPTPSTEYSTPNVAIGGILNTVQHVFLGMRWRP
jgi:hypothetical protein